MLNWNISSLTMAILLRKMFTVRAEGNIYKPLIIDAPLFIYCDNRTYKKLSINCKRIWCDFYKHFYMCVYVLIQVRFSANIFTYWSSPRDAQYFICTSIRNSTNKKPKLLIFMRLELLITKLSIAWQNTSIVFQPFWPYEYKAVLLWRHSSATCWRYRTLWPDPPYLLLRGI